MDLISKRSNWASSRVSALSLLLAFPPLASVDLGSSEADSSRKWATGQHLKTDTSGKLSSQKETSLQTTIVQGICSFSKEHIADLRANECHLCQLKGGPVFGILLQSNSEVLGFISNQTAIQGENDLRDDVLFVGNTDKTANVYAPQSPQFQGCTNDH